MVVLPEPRLPKKTYVVSARDQAKFGFVVPIIRGERRRPDYPRVRSCEDLSARTAQIPQASSFLLLYLQKDLFEG